MDPDDLTQWLEREVGEPLEPISWWGVIALAAIAALCVIMFIPLLAAVAP